MRSGGSDPMLRRALLLTVLFVSVAGAWAWSVNNRQSGSDFRTAAVSRGDINVSVSSTGNPNAVVTVQVGSQVSGSIIALYADFNSKVTKGELIARIDPAPFQAKVDQVKANLDAANANAINAQANVQKALASVQA